MEFSPQQTQAIRAFKNWSANPIDPFIVFGYAGTGKTTIAKHLCQDFAAPVYCAYTGKAVSVLKKMGCPNPRTIHQVLYAPFNTHSDSELEKLKHELGIAVGKGDDVQGARIAKKIEKLVQPAFGTKDYTDDQVTVCDLIVVDECSMLNQQVYDDLIALGKPLLFLGDPGQLPPIQGFNPVLSAKPNIMLDEIHRQARDNPILRIATDARNGKPIPFQEDGPFQKILKTNFDRDEFLKADQTLCGFHKTRYQATYTIRRLIGNEDSELPVQGERIICERNSKQYKISNGEQFTFNGHSDVDAETIFANITRYDDENGDPFDLLMYQNFFLKHSNRAIVAYKDLRDSVPFEFGHVITVHKGQGSQWDHVILLDDEFGKAKFNKKGDREKWLYTAITRACERLTIVGGL